MPLNRIKETNLREVIRAFLSNSHINLQQRVKTVCKKYKREVQGLQAFAFFAVTVNDKYADPSLK